MKNLAIIFSLLLILFSTGACRRTPTNIAQTGGLGEPGSRIPGGDDGGNGDFGDVTPTNPPAPPATPPAPPAIPPAPPATPPAPPATPPAPPTTPAPTIPNETGLSPIINDQTAQVVLFAFQRLLNRAPQGNEFYHFQAAAIKHGIAHAINALINTWEFKARWTNYWNVKATGNALSQATLNHYKTLNWNLFDLLYRGVALQDSLNPLAVGTGTYLQRLHNLRDELICGGCMNHYQQRLNSYNASNEHIGYTEEVLRSASFNKTIVQWAYIKFLGRRAELSGVNHWTGVINTHGIERFIAGILNSNEFKARARLILEKSGSSRNALRDPNFKNVAAHWGRYHGQGNATTTHWQVFNHTDQPNELNTSVAGNAIAGNESVYSDVTGIHGDITSSYSRVKFGANIASRSGTTRGTLVLFQIGSSGILRTKQIPVTVGSTPALFFSSDELHPQTTRIRWQFYHQLTGVVTRIISPYVSLER